VCPRDRPLSKWDRGVCASLAARIAGVAAANALDRSYKSPWAVEVVERGQASLLGRMFGPRGGKVDDITVVIGLVL
jgi:hypothetical protein